MKALIRLLHQTPDGRDVPRDVHDVAIVEQRRGGGLDRHHEARHRLLDRRSMVGSRARAGKPVAAKTELREVVCFSSGKQPVYYFVY